MRRIAAILKSSETATVRKAVRAAGASLVIVTPLSSHNDAVNLVMWYCDDASSTVDRPVRMEVIAEDANAKNIVSAILANARSGGIENIIPFIAGKLLQAILPQRNKKVGNV